MGLSLHALYTFISTYTKKGKPFYNFIKTKLLCILCFGSQWQHKKWKHAGLIWKTKPKITNYLLYLLSFTSKPREVPWNDTSNKSWLMYKTALPWYYYCTCHFVWNQTSEGMCFKSNGAVNTVYLCVYQMALKLCLDTHITKFYKPIWF